MHGALFPMPEPAAPARQARVIRILLGDVFAALAKLPDNSIDCVVTSPPYWGLRDYGTAKWEGGDPNCDHRSPTMREGRNEERAKLAGSSATNSYQNILAHHTGCGKCGARKVDHQLGLERSLGEHIDVMVRVFREVRRVLRPTGTLWLNYGDCYATAPNGRSAADTKAAGNDDRTFRDKPFSTVGPIIPPRHDDPFARSDGGRRGGGNNSSAELKPKDLCMIPNRLAIALQEDGWWVRSEIIWHKPNPMPESIKDRPGCSHEKVFLLTKSERYFYASEAVAELATTNDIRRPFAPGQVDKRGNGHSRGGGQKRKSGNIKRKHGEDVGRPGSHLGRSVPWEGITRNLRNVWTIPTAAFSEAHFATFPPELVERCLKAGCPVGGQVLDPFGGSGTTALVADGLGMDCTLIELNPSYVEIARKRLSDMFRRIDVEAVA